MSERAYCKGESAIDGITMPADMSKKCVAINIAVVTITITTKVVLVMTGNAEGTLGLDMLSFRCL